MRVPSEITHPARVQTKVKMRAHAFKLCKAGTKLLCSSYNSNFAVYNMIMSSILLDEKTKVSYISNTALSCHNLTIVCEACIYL